jgi:hypothetical protein
MKQVYSSKTRTMKSIIAGFAFVTILASCGTSNKEAELMRAQQRTIDSLNMVTAFQAQQLDQQKQLEEEKELAAATASTQRNTSTAKRSTARSRSYASSSPSYGSLPTATPQQQKKGWSNKAKGAVIGGVVGAGAGAIISKKDRWKGGVIGGVLGAGAGYGVGAILDNKKKNQ